jgi:predicted dehydrogenase
MKKMRVLVVGHGLIGAQRARAIFAAQKSEGGVSIAGTVDPAARDAALYDGAPAFKTLAEVPVASYDAAVIAVPHDVAGALSLQVLRAKKPVHLEKPLGLNLAQARSIHAAAAEVPLPSFVGYNYRFLPTMRAAYERVAAGTLGPLRNIDMFLGHGGHPRSTDDWKLKPESAGGGVLIDPGVHLLDLVLSFAPSATCEFISATRGFWKTGIEEDVVVVLRDEKLLATVRVSLVRWVNTCRIEIGGEDGYALIEGRGGNYGAQTIRIGKRWAWADGSKRSQKETEEIIDFGAENRSLADETAAVVACWRGASIGTAQPRPATMDDALRVAELCDEMYARLAR